MESEDNRLAAEKRTTKHKSAKKTLAEIKLKQLNQDAKPTAIQQRIINKILENQLAT